VTSELSNSAASAEKGTADILATSASLFFNGEASASILSRHAERPESPDGEQNRANNPQDRDKHRDIWYIADLGRNLKGSGVHNVGHNQNYNNLESVFG
jgi:hypothetical protein